MTQDSRPFEDIAPYPDSMFHEKMQHLVKEPGFEHAVKWVLPNVDYKEMCDDLLQVRDKDTFQHKIMWPFLEMLASKTTSGLTIEGIDRIDPSKAYTFITNHRDIVLDTSFLNLCFLRSGYPTTQVAIGNNLLIYEWISDLVRLNKSFIVKRDLPKVKALEAAKELSSYIHFTVGEEGQSVWIAERQGRSKDSSDLAQDSLIKMLGLAGDGDFRDNLKEINLLPVSISYEYDPNDYLKAREFLLRRNDPEFKKTQRDDLFAMETGLLQPKGRVHFNVGTPLNPFIDLIPEDADKSQIARDVCDAVDSQIHSGYMIFPINYIAYDKLHGSSQFADRYTSEEEEAFERYIRTQLEKVDIPELTDGDNVFLYEMMLTMYANPLKNKISAETCSSEA
ncbi:MAG: acyltransferase [Muribaculum sp.]|nr:acyltransferase [Muribaculum sp.]